MNSNVLTNVKAGITAILATLTETVANLLYQIDTDKLTGGTTTWAHTTSASC